MHKNKTNKSARKRIKVTATGKIKHAKCGKRHLNAGKTGNRKRGLRQKDVMDGRVARKYVTAIEG